MNIFQVLPSAILWSAFVSLVFFALAGYVTTYAFYLGMSEGMFFERWGNFVKGKFWLKALGGCMICTSFWMPAVLMAIWHFFTPALLVIVSGSLAVLLINKYR